MAKIAQLHNGTQIHFPDDMPDHEMDATVQKHLGVISPDQLLQHKTQVVTGAAHVDAVNAMAEAVKMLREPLMVIADSSQKIAMAISELSAKMAQVGSPPVANATLSEG